MVFLKVPGAQGHLTLQAGLHSQHWLVNAVVAVNLHGFGQSVVLHVQMRYGGLVTLNDAAEFEVPLEGAGALKFLSTLRATWERFATLVRDVHGLADASSAVVVPTGENHWVGEEVKADGTAQLVNKLLLRLG